MTKLIKAGLVKNGLLGSCWHNKLIKFIKKNKNIFNKLTHKNTILFVITLQITY